MIETSEVADLIEQADPKLRIINAGLTPPGTSTDVRAQHNECRLTELSQFFSIKEVTQPGSDLPNTWPSAEVFAEHMRALRVRKDDLIICYDHVGMYSVARCAYMLRFFGATNVRIMNGGMRKWISEGRPTFSGPYSAGEGLPADGDYSYQVSQDDLVIRDIKKVHEVVSKLHNGETDWQITDARAAARFNGETQEPNGLRAGNITGSINVPFSGLVDQETGCLKEEADLRAAFDKANVAFSGKRTIHSCNSGVTACIVDLAF